jgi:hypothetical protein
VTLNNLTRRAANARGKLIDAKYRRSLSPEEKEALGVLTTYMRMATAAPMTGLLKMAERVREMERVDAKIRRILRLPSPDTSKGGAP